MGTGFRSVVQRAFYLLWVQEETHHKAVTYAFPQESDKPLLKPLHLGEVVWLGMKSFFCVTWRIISRLAEMISLQLSVLLNRSSHKTWQNEEQENGADRVSKVKNL